MTDLYQLQVHVEALKMQLVDAEKRIHNLSLALSRVTLENERLRKGIKC